ncbi:MAG TPA: hypothetical protein VH185_02850 [Mycobacterium sp.]|nr:hypothetical protein [Mycobacterium sp.]
MDTTSDVSDEALESAGSWPPYGLAGSSLWSTIDVSGCTCIG